MSAVYRTEPDTLDAAAGRRAFLAGLAALPMLGGGVKLIGRPTAADVVPTVGLLQNYEAWLAWERFRLQRELWGDEVARKSTTFLAVNRPAEQWHNPWQEGDACPEPSTRAALVMATVGCPLDGGTFQDNTVWRWRA